MKTQLTNTYPISKGIKRTFIGTAVILMIPVVMMQFSDDWDWGLFDFIVIGTLLMGTGFTYVLLASKVGNVTHRAILAFVLLVSLLLIWAELAVGVFGTPFAGS